MASELPFKGGLPASSTTNEPKKWPCTGKLLIERKVDYAGAWPDNTPKPSVTGN